MREELAAQIAKDLVLTLIENNQLALHLRTRVKDYLKTESDIEEHNKKIIHHIHAAYQEAYAKILQTID